MIVSIHQPSYFPWLGLLDKINRSDLYVFLDNVQLADRAFQHRNIFLVNTNKEHLLTIPINKKNYRNKEIKELTLIDTNWQEKHLKFFDFNYKKHPYYTEISVQLENLYKKKYLNLSDILYDSMLICFRIFNIKTKIVRASSLNLNPENFKESMILEILEKTNATTYLSGTGAKEYQKNDNFKKKNIELLYQDFHHPVYTQFKNDDFILGLSSLDFAFNQGINNSKEILGKLI